MKGITMNDSTHRLLELDKRHNHLLEQLAELDRQTSGILENWLKMKEQREQNTQLLETGAEKNAEELLEESVELLEAA